MLTLIVDCTLAWLQNSCLRLFLTAPWLDCYMRCVVEGSGSEHILHFSSVRAAMQVDDHTVRTG